MTDDLVEVLLSASIDGNRSSRLYSQGELRHFCGKAATRIATLEAELAAVRDPDRDPHRSRDADAAPRIMLSEFSTLRPAANRRKRGLRQPHGRETVQADQTRR